MEDKILFCEILLSEITVMNRAIWDNPTSYKVQLEALKWSNELVHRVWNLLFELKRGEDNDVINRLGEYINFYRKQSEEFAEHLSATIPIALNRLYFMKK